MTTLPDKTALPTLGLKKQTGQVWLNVVLAILLVATTLPLSGGADAVHCVCGMFLLVGCGIHLALHARRIKAVLLEPGRNVTPSLRRQRRLFWGMLLSGFLCGLSGMVALPLAHIPHDLLRLLCCGKPIHTLSGLTFFSLSIYHLVLHRNWFRKNLGTFSIAARR